MKRSSLCQTRLQLVKQPRPANPFIHLNQSLQYLHVFCQGVGVGLGGQGLGGQGLGALLVLVLVVLALLDGGGPAGTGVIQTLSSLLPLLLPPSVRRQLGQRVVAVVRGVAVIWGEEEEGGMLAQPSCYGSRNTQLGRVESTLSVKETRRE